jgi:hypothetical protein
MFGHESHEPVTVYVLATIALLSGRSRSIWSQRERRNAHVTDVECLGAKDRNQDCSPGEGLDAIGVAAICRV